MAQNGTKRHKTAQNDTKRHKTAHFFVLAQIWGGSFLAPFSLFVEYYSLPHPHTPANGQGAPLRPPDGEARRGGRPTILGNREESGLAD